MQDGIDFDSLWDNYKTVIKYKWYKSVGALERSGRAACACAAQGRGLPKRGGRLGLGLV